MRESSQVVASAMSVVSKNGRGAPGVHYVETKPLRYQKNSGLKSYNVCKAG